MSESEPVVQERIVVVALDFDGRPNHGSLEEDLVAAIADLGHQITVVSMDARTGPYAIPSVNALVDIRRVTVPPMLRRAPSILRRLWTQLLALREAATLRDLDPTRVVYFGPAFLALGPVWMLASRRRGGPVVVLVQWDFFPIHHEQIGRLPRLLSRRILKCLERSAIGVADTILVMSRKNAEFLARYHPGLSAHVEVQPTWGGKLNGGINASGKGRDQRFTVVFGGQLTAGRGVEGLLKAADLLQQRNFLLGSFQTVILKLGYRQLLNDNIRTGGAKRTLVVDDGQMAILGKVDIQLDAALKGTGPAKGRHGVFRHALGRIMQPSVSIAEPAQYLPLRMVAASPGGKDPKDDQRDGGTKGRNAGKKTHWNLLLSKVGPPRSLSFYSIIPRNGCKVTIRYPKENSKISLCWPSGPSNSPHSFL